MKAAVLHGPGSFKVEETRVPRAGPQAAPGRVAAGGARHTELHYIEPGVSTFKKPPIVLGHEASGVVEETGSEVTNVRKGQRVLIPAVLTCGRCRFCRQGRGNNLADMPGVGDPIEGGD